MTLSYVPAKKISLARLSTLDEKWVEDIIRQETSQDLLGLGILHTFHSQVIHQHAGRLDLIAEGERGQYFIIELMLGELDASHLTRVMEYFLREKKQHSDRDWSAVIVAENIRESRYFDLLQFLAQKLHNDLPLIAIEMTALMVGEATTLHFATVVDSRIQDTEPSVHASPRGPEEWLKRSSESSMKIVREVGEMLKEIDASISPRYNSEFIGTTVGVRAHNFVVLRPRKKHVLVRVLISDSHRWAEKLMTSGMQVILAADHKIRFSLQEENTIAQRALLKELFAAAFKEKFGQSEDAETSGRGVFIR